MRIQSVTAHAFGPLRDQTLELAEAMTVIVGDNESAKSTWHAAIFAALCGRRRTRGRPSPADQHFMDLHKPWDSEDWLVSAQIVLDDGRRIEMRQDLAGKVDCHARDLQLGRDISSEVINEGAPDGALWLGLDRSSFVATACIGQAEMLKVLGDANGLQDHLQRAADTAGVDATAAAALECLELFQRDHVGLDRSNTTKPLHRAGEDLGRAKKRLGAAQLAHREYLARVEQVDELRGAVSGTADLLRSHEAALARRSAENFAVCWARARDLHAIYGDDKPVSIADEDAVSVRVARALAAWQSRPAEPTQTERPSPKVQADIDALPQPPVGDTEVHPSVQVALEDLTLAQTRIQLHDGSRPQTSALAPPLVAAADDELLDLAWILETAPLVVPASLAQRENAARKATEAGGTRSPAAVAVLACGIAAAIVGMALLFVVGPAVGAVLLAVGFGLVALGALRRGRSRAVASSALAEARAELLSARQQAAAIEERRAAAVARCRSLGLEPAPAVLREIPVVRAHAAAHANDLGRWENARQGLQSTLAEAASALAGALASRGHQSSGPDERDVLRAVEEYRQACGRRALDAREAARSGPLTAELAASRAAEQRATQDLEARKVAADQIVAAAQACGFSPARPEKCAVALEEWSTRRGTTLGELVHAQEEWAELQALLAGRNLADLEEAARAADLEASQLEATVAPALLESPTKKAEDCDQSKLREQVRKAAQRADTAAGELAQFAAGLDPVCEAEEALEAAEAEMARVRELDETLTLTRRFLESAQTQVHRDIAPVLARTVRRWLPLLTGGRYTDVTVDPITLQVHVCGPLKHWRQAEHLSYGTAEQIYLLLRVALADHLTMGHDTCPLILDDVTVHADSDRTLDVLELLLDISQQRQVILFTQEDQVAAWARDKLAPPSHAVHELQPITTV